eukprot:jgi/Mesvir1/12104/Mv00372-RA.1
MAGLPFLAALIASAFSRIHPYRTVNKGVRRGKAGRALASLSFRAQKTIHCMPAPHTVRNASSFSTEYVRKQCVVRPASQADLVPIVVAVAAILLSEWTKQVSTSFHSPSRFMIPSSRVILGIGLAISAYLYGKLPHWRGPSLPGPKPTWLVGNLIDILREGGMPEALTKWRGMYGNLFKFYFGRRLIVVVTDVELAKEVTMKKFKIFHDRPQPPFVTDFNKKGLVFSKGVDWASARNALLPLFHKGMLNNFMPVMERSVAELVTCLRAVPDASTPVDMNELFHKAAMDIIGDVALGVAADDLTRGGSLDFCQRFLITACGC